MKRRGRPSLVPGERGIPVSVVVSQTMYDALAKRALARQMEMSSYLRTLLGHALRSEFSIDKSTSPMP